MVELSVIIPALDERDILNRLLPELIARLGEGRADGLVVEDAVEPDPGLGRGDRAGQLGPHAFQEGPRPRGGVDVSGPEGPGGAWLSLEGDHWATASWGPGGRTSGYFCGPA